MIACNDNCKYLDKYNCICNNTGDSLIFYKCDCKDMKSGKSVGIYTDNNSNELRQVTPVLYIHEGKCVKNIRRYPYADFQRNEDE